MKVHSKNINNSPVSESILIDGDGEIVLITDNGKSVTLDPGRYSSYIGYIRQHRVAWTPARSGTITLSNQ